MRLSSDALEVAIDPAHGAEVRELVHRPSGLQLLGQPPFAPETVPAGELDEETWTRAYRGGWQFLTPNAGAACEVDGVRHGFHGRSSTAPWALVDVSDTRASMQWIGHGLEVTRTYAVEGEQLEVDTRWRALDDAVPIITTEHFVVGPALLDPEVVIRMPGGPAAERHDEGGPLRAPDGAPRWPELGLLDGGVERADRWSFDQSRSRYAVVEDLAEGWAEVANATTGLTVRLEWDVERLPHVWLWHEARGSGGLWDQRAELLGVEPASTPHGLGLAAAVEHDQATWVRPGEDVSSRLCVRVVQEEAAA